MCAVPHNRARKSLFSSLSHVMSIPYKSLSELLSIYLHMPHHTTPSCMSNHHVSLFSPSIQIAPVSNRKHSIPSGMRSSYTRWKMHRRSASPCSTRRPSTMSSMPTRRLRSTSCWRALSHSRMTSGWIWNRPEDYVLKLICDLRKVSSRDDE